VTSLLVPWLWLCAGQDHHWSIGKAITAVDVTYDGEWVLATTDDYLMVVKTTYQSAGEHHHIPAYVDATACRLYAQPAYSCKWCNSNAFGRLHRFY
jgi:hypothetical protein